MEIIIRKAIEKDYPELLVLIKKLAHFERAPEKVTNSVKKMKEEKDYFHAYVAETLDKKIVGMAIYFFAYYTWVGKSLYLDDLYVLDSYRGRKIGEKLFRKIFQIANIEKCKRIRWQVLNWNTPSLEFYKKYGAIEDDEWINCDVDEKKIINFKL